MALAKAAKPKNGSAESVSKLSGRKLVAISYTRVSTGKQAEADKSGEERQELAIGEWLRHHPEYELDRAVRAVVSGAKAGRFEWFIGELEQGRLPRGACLVVEQMSRLGREPLNDTLRTLLRIFDAGGSIACCSLLGGKVLDSLSSEAGAIYVLAGAIDAARVEHQDKSDRAKGASALKRRLIREGQTPFTERTKEKPLANYPFWLDYNAKEGCFKENRHAAWVRHVFEWAKEIGSTEICKRLKAQGVRSSVDGKTPYTAPGIVSLLKNPAVTGERRLYKGQRLTGETITGAYPAIVSREDFELVREAVKKRHCGQGAVASPRLHNLFENRSFCVHCGNRLGNWTQAQVRADGSTRVYSYLRCMTHHYDKDKCPAHRRPYQERRILERFQSFHWDDFFNSDRHNADLREATTELLRTEDVRNDVVRKSNNVKDILRKQAREGRAIKEFLEDDLQKLNEEYEEADRALNIAAMALEKLKRKRSGKDAAKATRDLVEAFVGGDCNDLGNRQRFNRWLFDTSLVVAYDLVEDRFEIGIGEIAAKGRRQQLIGLDQRMEDAVALGIDEESARAFVAAHP